jgi:hypothetical protein
MADAMTVVPLEQTPADPRDSRKAVYDAIGRALNEISAAEYLNSHGLTVRARDKLERARFEIAAALTLIDAGLRQ